jgi:quercetin dioxygenase-like cupin family protein
MSFLDVQQLPFVGMSYEFVGEKEGAPFSAYIVKAKPGQGPLLHKHPYVEVAFTLDGCATITVGNETREVKAGAIVVIPANTPHRFINSGDTICVKSTSTPVRDLFRRISNEALSNCRYFIKFRMSSAI